jgi:hypothetical protein
MNMRNANLPSVSLLWDRYDYKPLTGELIIKRTGKPISPHKRLRNHYYTFVWRSAGKRFDYATTVGRFVMTWLTGDWPTKQVDHINRDTGDNRFCNLRLVTSRENAMNRAFFKGGVTQLPSGNWRARIRHDGKQHSLGAYSTKEEAMAVYSKATQEFQGS